MSKKKRGLFPEIAPQGGIIPDRSGSIQVEDILLVRRSMHEYSREAAMVLRLRGGPRAIEKACELIDKDAHFTCIIDQDQMFKLLKLLLGQLAGHKLDDMSRLVQPIGIRR